MAESKPTAPDRRADDSAVLMLVTQVNERLVKLDDKLSQHMTDETKELAEAMNVLLNNAFPGGDPGSHKALHIAQLEAATDKAKFWKQMVFDLSKWGLIGVLGWLTVTAWLAFIKGPR